MKERTRLSVTLYVHFLSCFCMEIVSVLLTFFLENANPFPLNFPSHVVIYYLRMTAVIY